MGSLHKVAIAKPFAETEKSQMNNTTFLWHIASKENGPA